MQIYRVADALPGTLWIMPHPPADALNEALRDCRAMGVQWVVSLLEIEETRQLGLAAEDTACASAGLRFLSFPIADFGTPGAGFADLVARIVAALGAGEGVAIHCRAGIGRSGTVAACALAACGLSPQAAIDALTRARGVDVPETIEQRKFIFDFCSR